MTLTQYEAGLSALPSHQRGVAAGPAYALRQRLVIEPTFANALAGILAQKNQTDRLASSGQLATFTALTGP